MYTKVQSRFIFQLLTVLATGSLILSACSSAVATPTPHGESLAPTTTSEPTVVSTPDGSLQLSLNIGSMATGFKTETVAAVSAGSGAPYWEILPEYTRSTLQGYPISSHAMQPQIFIYPIEDLRKANEGADKGLRYLTQFNQGIVPINNTDMIYSFQGLTNDGKYYVAALLPVNHPSLPADGKVTGNEPPEFMNNHSAYLANVAKDLNVQAANTYTPDLTQMDALLSSLEIK
jgi:hypothetical protein